MPENLARDLILIMPLLVLCAGALLIPIIDVFRRDEWSREGFTLGCLILALFADFYSVRYSGRRMTVFNGMLFADPLFFFLNFLLILGSMIAVLIGVGRIGEQGIEARAEYYSLILMSTAGASIFASSAEMITLFLGLEIMSMALYCLCGSALNDRSSSESALKYFLLGSFSSAFLLYGIAIIYGLSGSTRIDLIGPAIAAQSNPALHFGIGMLLVGLVFKVGGVPFHFWAPDVYQGAPTTVTAYMACVVKAAAMVAALRVLWTALGSQSAVWLGAVWIVAVLTMTLGNLAALRQRSVKRMLAYSSIAHAGYMLVTLLLPGQAALGGAALLFYLFSYTFMTLGSFGVVLVVASSDPKQPKNDDISRFHGLGYSRPLLAFFMTIFMLSLAGIPPGIAGLLGKFYIFSAAVKSQYVGIAIIGVINSAISCYYYLRVIVAMYFLEAPEGASQPEPLLGFQVTGALGLCAAALLIFGLMPGSIYNGAMAVMSML
jgi:NADH-quinone oxidoreductase subunit N